jgi:hypothetical protein
MATSYRNKDEKRPRDAYNGQAEIQFSNTGDIETLGALELQTSLPWCFRETHGAERKAPRAEHTQQIGMTPCALGYAARDLIEDAEDRVSLT